MVLINAYAGVVRRRQGTSSRHLRPSRCQRAGTMRGTIHRFDNGSERRIVYREVPGAHAMVEIEDKLDLGSHGISRTRSRSPRSSTLSSLFSGLWCRSARATFGCAWPANFGDMGLRRPGLLCGWRLRSCVFRVGSWQRGSACGDGARPRHDGPVFRADWQWLWRI